jgi:hypothetical protein
MIQSPNPEETQVLDVLHPCGPLNTYQQLIAQNDALILSPELNHGRAITTARTAIYTALVAAWAEQQRAFGFDQPFAVVALGGTGRGEVTPCSDLDFAFLFEHGLEGNTFLMELQRQTLHTDEFRMQHGFACTAFPFGLDDVPGLAEKQLNSFLDMRAVYDPTGLTERFREKIRETYDPFEHFLHVRSFWKQQWEQAGEACERLDRFDIKNDGLRLFLGGIWTLGGKEFRHSHEIYAEIEDSRDLAAYEFLLRIRCWIHLRRPPGGHADPFGNHPEDVLGFDDFISFGDMLGSEATERERFDFANDVRARLLSARRRLAAFSRGIIERELHHGRRISSGNPIIFGASGLYRTSLEAAATSYDRSRAALSLLLASQRYGVPVDPAEMQGLFRGAGDWLVPVPEVSMLFQEERGSLAESFEFLSRMDGAMDRLFPGYGRFETSLDERVMAQRTSMRGTLERDKMRALEDYVNAGAERMKTAISSTSLASDEDAARVALVTTVLDADHLTAVKLALKTKRLPLTPKDEAARADANRPWHERFASGFSGIPLANYYTGWDTSCGFTLKTLEVTQFLVANRRAFKDRARIGINPSEEVEAFARLCGDEQRLRALFVFTYADRIHWESEQSDPVRWWNTRELYSKTLRHFRPVPAGDPAQALREAGYGEQELAILRDFGHDFFSGMYQRHAARFGAHLLRIVEEGDAVGPKVAIVRDGASTLLGVAARDWPGLAACISGSLWRQGIELRQAHLFSAMNQGLALDFFHIASGGKELPADLTRTVQQAIRQHLHIAVEDEAALPEIRGSLSLTESRPGQCCLRFESSQNERGHVYALCYKVFRHLHGDIHGLTAHSTRHGAFVSVYHHLPPDLSLSEAQQIVAGWG